jgi:hypothetical protein
VSGALAKTWKKEESPKRMLSLYQSINTATDAEFGTPKIRRKSPDIGDKNHLPQLSDSQINLYIFQYINILRLLFNLLIFMSISSAFIYDYRKMCFHSAT